jgi:hypothetical protein
VECRSRESSETASRPAGLNRAGETHHACGAVPLATRYDPTLGILPNIPGGVSTWGLHGTAGAAPYVLLSVGSESGHVPLPSGAVRDAPEEREELV